MTTTGVDAGAVARATERVRELATAYEPPRFAHVPDPDAALFLCAVDHRTGYRGPLIWSAGATARGQRAHVGGWDPRRRSADAVC